MLRDYRCVVISQRVFKREVQDIRSKLEANLTSLRSAAKHQHGFLKSHNYTLSPFLKEMKEQKASSVIISEWNGEVDWEVLEEVVLSKSQVFVDVVHVGDASKNLEGAGRVFVRWIDLTIGFLVF
jgi:hypothetical protein